MSCVSALAQGADTLAVQKMAWDPVELLHGQPGVIVSSSATDPGSTPTVYIGGARLNQSQQPVYVVDGIRVRDLSMVPAGDCESIRVLEGSEAIAHWGPDAAAGVVVVTTRKAREKGFHAHYSFLGASQEITDLPEPVYETNLSESIDRHLFHRQHIAGATFRNRWLGIRASFAADKGDGYYVGDKDRTTRYVTSVSVDATILPWMGIEASGAYAWMQESGGGVNWLSNCLNSLGPIEDSSRDWDSWKTMREEHRIRADWVFRPVDGLRVSAFFSGRRDGRDGKTVYWDGRDVGRETVSGGISRTQLQRIEYGLDIGWEYAFPKGHRVMVDGDLHQVRSWNAFRRSLPTDSPMISEIGIDWLDNESYWDYSIGQGYDFWEYKDIWWQGHGTVAYSWHDRVEARGGVMTRSGDGEWMASKPSWSPYFSLKGTVLNRPYITLRADWAKVGQGVVERSGEEWSRVDASLPYIYNPYNTYKAYLLWNRSVRRSVGVELSSSPQATWRIGATYYRNHDHIGAYRSSIISTVRNSVRNEGLILSGQWSLQRRDWRVNLSGNYARMRNRVSTEYDNDYTATMSRLYDGYPVGTYTWFALEGVDKETGNPIWKYDENGVVTTRLGGTMPRASYAVHATVSWRNLGLTVSGYGWGGNRITNWANWHYNELLKDCWTPENPDAPLPKQVAGNLASMVFESDKVHPRHRFFKLGQVSLSCGLPRSWATRIGMSEAKVWVSLEDIACWSNYSGMDPEAALMDASMGYEISRYPLMSRALLGLSLAF